MERKWRAGDYSALFLRLALSAAFLSAVADRFGWWGRPGEAHVGWGDFAHFTAYTARLTSILPIALVPTLAWTATILEILFGLALLFGIATRVAALLSGALLLLFAMAMAFALGIKSPLDYSVFSASAGAFLLSACERYKLSVDELRHGPK